MLSINGKKFMNLPEAVQWLLNNNALPFQCKANYVADTIIAKSDIINPSPAEIKVGSLVLFADSKVGTVSGVTDAGFMVGQEYTDIGDQLNQITSINLDASGHLIFTLGNGDTIDAGLVKNVSGLSINASQHLIVSYNDGSTSDLGAIFQGNVNISGNLTADSIIENMSGYSFTRYTADIDWAAIYVGVVKNGNKLTLVIFGTYERTAVTPPYTADIGNFQMPDDVMAKLYPYTIAGEDRVLSSYKLNLQNDANVEDIQQVTCQILKTTTPRLQIRLLNVGANTTNGNTYYFRIEQTFLLSDNMAA